MAFALGNVEKFLEHRQNFLGISDQEKKEILERAEKDAYLGMLSGSCIEEVFGKYSIFFEGDIQIFPDHMAIFFQASKEFNLRDGSLHLFREGVEKILIEGGFSSYVPRERRGFYILSTGEDMTVLNHVGNLAGERVKDLGAVIMSIGFGEMELDREEGKKYKTHLEKSGLNCRLFETPDYPEGTGAVYLYVKAN